jgi:catechol 2,3-dioxygenase-like lactoylglutathione lyase family enzyme
LLTHSRPPVSQADPQPAAGPWCARSNCQDLWIDLGQVAVSFTVTDVDRAKSFYVDTLGFHLDGDLQPTETMRVVHMTPPGSACSVVVGPAVVDADADLGSGARFQLVVTDIEAARAQLLDRGVEVSEVHALDPRDGGKFVYFTDPDGNNWAVQEIRDHVGRRWTNQPLRRPRGRCARHAVHGQL